MQKKTKTKKSQDQTILQSAGQIIGTIGHGIMEGKDLVVDTAQSIIKKLTASHETNTPKTTRRKKKVTAGKSTKAPHKSALKGKTAAAGAKKQGSKKESVKSVKKRGRNLEKLSNNKTAGIAKKTKSAPRKKK